MGVEVFDRQLLFFKLAGEGKLKYLLLGVVLSSQVVL
jgi:hypothetical protein